MGSAGVASTHLGRLEGQPGAGAGRKPLKAPSQPYETQPLCLFTRETSPGPIKGHICSLKQKQTRSPLPRVPGPGAGKERGSGHAATLGGQSSPLSSSQGSSVGRAYPFVSPMPTLRLREGASIT